MRPRRAIARFVRSDIGIARLVERDRDAGFGPVDLDAVETRAPNWTANVAIIPSVKWGGPSLSSIPEASVPTGRKQIMAYSPG